MLIIKDYEEKLYKKIRETGKYNSFSELEKLSEDDVNEYIKRQYPQAYEKFIQRVFDKPVEISETGHWKANGSDFTWQYEMKDAYRGCTCSVDVLELPEKGMPIIHEIKSVSKMKYDRVCGTGMRKNQMAEPDHSHCLQVALYAMSYDKETGIMPRCYIHYVNADDYRVSTFEIEAESYLDELDQRIDAIYTAFAEHRLGSIIPSPS